MEYTLNIGNKDIELLLKKARELVLEEKLLITYDNDNIGSYKIIEN